MLSKVVKSLSHRSFHVAKAYHGLRYRRALARDSDPILIYQMGKVGSTTVLKSLHALGLGRPIYHVHMLTPEAIERFAHFVKSSFSCDLVKPSQRMLLVRHLMGVQQLRKMLDRQHHIPQWKVITLVRDPVARNLSSFFEVLDPEMHYGLEANLRAKGHDAVVQELCTLFLEAYPEHDLPLTFFDTEFKRVLGLDVFASPFSTEKGYQIYTGAHADTLLVRAENLEQCAREAFAEFLGLPAFELTNANMGGDKGYAHVYRRVLEAIVLPEAYLEKMYNSKYALHFYSRDEIAAFQAKWRRPVRV